MENLRTSSRAWISVYLSAPPGGPSSKPRTRFSAAADATDGFPAQIQMLADRGERQLVDEIEPEDVCLRLGQFRERVYQAAELLAPAGDLTRAGLTQGQHVQSANAWRAGACATGIGTNRHRQAIAPSLGAAVIPTQVGQPLAYKVRATR